MVKKYLAAFLLFILSMATFFSILGTVPSYYLARPLDSFKVLLNMLFDRSEAYQLYLYERFVLLVRSDFYEGYIFVACVIIAVLVAVCCYFATKSRVVCFVLLFIFASVQVYLGVFAAPWWNILLCATFAWLLLKDARMTFFAAATILAVAVAIVFYPGTSELLSQASNAIRDYIGNTVERPVVGATSPQDIAAQEEVNPLEMQQELAGLNNGEATNEFGINLNEIFTGSQIGTAIGQRLWVLRVIALAFVLGFLAWFLNKVRKAYTVRKLFDAADNAVAIDSMFKHLQQWLLQFGLAQADRPYAENAHNIEGYAGIVTLWQKAVYSSHSMTDNDKNKMRKFLEETKNSLTRNPVIRLRLFLMLEPGGESECTNI